MSNSLKPLDDLVVDTLAAAYKDKRDLAFDDLVAQIASGYDYDSYAVRASVLTLHNSGRIAIYFKNYSCRVIWVP